jgi:uncharacterized repeat protein (TIGR01451 family)
VGLAVLIAFIGLISVLALGAVSNSGLVSVPTASAQNASGYAVEVVSFTRGIHTVDDVNCPPNDQGGTASSILGAPDDPAGDGSMIAGVESTSLGVGGSVTVRFAQPAAGDGDPATADVWVWETGPAAEHYLVEVSEDGTTFVGVGESNQTTHGSQGFDVDHAGFDDTSRIFYMRVTDLATGEPVACDGVAGINEGGFYVGGSDIDAVGVITAAPFPALEIDKSSDAAPEEPLVLGDTITYFFDVTNTGNVDLTDVTVTDDLAGLSAIDPPSVATLAPDETATFTATYTVTQADVDNGTITNTASVTGTPTGFCPGCEPPTDEDTEITPPDQTPGLAVDKSADPVDGLAVGDIVTYTFVATNTGNVTLTDVTVTDELAGLSAIDPPSVASLAPRETATFIATYEVTQADVDAGEIVNSATVTGTPPDGCVDCPPPVSPPDSVTIIIPPAPSLTIEKTADTEGPVAEGDVITYTFTVTNTGNVTIDSATITDELAGLTWVTGPTVGPIPVGESVTGTATYTVTAADEANGGVTNSATVSCDAPVICDPVPPDEITIPYEDPGLTIEKTADPIGGVVAGDVITYTFTLENTGNILLEDVVITDQLAGLTWVTGPEVGDIPVGESATGSATYVVTQEDVDNGGVTNSASADCAVSCIDEPPIGEVTVTPDQTPGLTIVKEADTAGPVSAGDVITYSFTVENIGTTTLADVTITDALAGLTWVTGPDVGSLAPGDIVVGEATYTVTAEDVAAGGVTNSATVDCAVSCLPEPPTDEVTIPGAAPGLTIEKSADPAAEVNAGDVITYSFTATNTGNVELADVTISDSLAGLEWVTGPNLGTLAPGASAVGTATYTVTTDDVAAGSVVNSATVTGTPPGGGTPPVSPPSEVTVPTGPVPAPGALTIEKSADATDRVHPGDLVTFTFVVTNTGETEVTNVTVSDALPGLGPIEGPQGTTLAPGESATFTAEYAVTELDADNGFISNTATATGTDAAGSTVGDDDTVNLEACSLPGTVPPSPTPGPGTPEADDLELDEDSQFEGAAECSGVVIPNPTDPPVDPQPTQPSGGNGGGGGGGGGGPITQLPSTGQADAGNPAFTTILPLGALVLLGLAMMVALAQRRKAGGRQD